MASDMDMLTKRPRTPQILYTDLTDTQIHNIKKNAKPFFHINDRTTSVTKPPKEGGRYYVDRYCQGTNPHNMRGMSLSQPFGWIDEKKNRSPPEEYNTCRGRAWVRWGPNKAGERTRSHAFGESSDRYTTIDMYRRNPTNYPGRVVMDCGRPTDGYYGQKFPSRTTWFGSGVPMNRTEVMGSVYKKTVAEYEEIKEAEQTARAARRDQWPEFSEYTEKFVLRSKTRPTLSNLEERKAALLA